MSSLIKKPSVWLPVVLSLVVLVTMLIYIAISGVPTRQPDEGTGAHLFQIWLVLEVLMVAFFAIKIKWLPQAPKQSLWVLAIQILAVLAACAPVFYFKL
jgi:hypothetical protein